MSEANIITINGVAIDLADSLARSFLDNAHMKNGLFRGKNFGAFNSAGLTAFLQEHKVATGEFTDLYVGDYFTLNDGTYNKTWVIAGFDTEYNKGDSALTTHHISCIPRDPGGLCNSVMNDSNVITGGFVGSKMWTSTLPAIVSALQNVCGSHLLKRRCLLSNSASTTIASMAGNGWTGATNGWGWYDAYATLMSEVQVYGSTVFSSSFYDVGEAYEKLPYFNFMHPVENGRASQWLRAAASSTSWAFVSNDGLAAGYGASYSLAVRPLICLG